MSVAFDIIEYMFDHGAMTPPPHGSAGLAGSVGSAALATGGDAARGETVRELQARIRSMQRHSLDTRALPTAPAIAELLPGGALSAGGAYVVPDSTTLALTLLQAPSAAGSWCAVVGMPDLGVEAAVGLGLDPDRLVLVPHPGEQWAAVLSALIDVVTVVLVRRPVRNAGRGDRERVSEALAGRIGTRLRQREAVLVSLGDWPRADARLAVTDVDWAGIGSGFGHLSARQATVGSVSRAWEGRTRSRRLWLPGPDGRVEPVAARDARAPATPLETGGVRALPSPARFPDPLEEAIEFEGRSGFDEAAGFDGTGRFDEDRPRPADPLPLQSAAG